MEFLALQCASLSQGIGRFDERVHSMNFIPRITFWSDCIAQKFNKCAHFPINRHISLSTVMKTYFHTYGLCLLSATIFNADRILSSHSFILIKRDNEYSQLHKLKSNDICSILNVVGYRREYIGDTFNFLPLKQTEHSKIRSLSKSSAVLRLICLPLILFHTFVEFSSF